MTSDIAYFIFIFQESIANHSHTASPALLKSVSRTPIFPSHFSSSESFLAAG